MSRPRAAALLAAGLLLATAACSSADGAAPPPDASTAASTSATGGTGGAGSAVLAFAGDVHFEGSSASTTDLGSAFDVLAGADLAVVNLETAVTTGGTKVDKQYAFRAPPKAMTALHDAGVDAVTVANNHGMDYGASGLQDTLAAGRAAHLRVLGAGDDVDAAFAPLRAEPGGVPVSVIAATDVIDSSVETAWTATASTPGLASAKDEDRLLADVRRERAAGRVVVVFLHWGAELVQCPTARQRSLAADLAAAGASAVVGSHAHVLQPTGEVGSGDATAFVAYGMGNFHFYAADDKVLGTQTGVLTVDVDRGGVTGTKWHPARIRSGKPELLTDAQLASGSRSADELAELGQQCAAGRTPAPAGGGASAAPSSAGGGSGSSSDDGSGGSSDDSARDGAGDGADGGPDRTSAPAPVPATSGPAASPSGSPSGGRPASPSATAGATPGATP